jgi:uncharacterized protein (TIGR03435 family)
VEANTLKQISQSVVLYAWVFMRGAGTLKERQHKGQVLNKNTILVIWVSLVIALGAFMLVKRVWFPSVPNVWFQLDAQRLHKAPSNVMIFRETQLASRRSGCLAGWMQSKPGEAAMVRYLGRNVPLAQAIPFAYQCQPSRVAMPPDAPTNHYDFLVTLEHQPAEHLQQAIRNHTGYVADWQERETKVWLLKVVNPGAFPASTNEFYTMRFKDGRCVFTHAQLGTLASLAENGLRRPVQDQTGLSGYYDFSVPLNLVRGTAVPDDETIKKTLGETGLALEDGSAAERMLVVHKP